MSDSEYDIPEPLQNIGCQDLLEYKCSHCGWLRKRRNLVLLSWPRVYVVLHKGCFYYFKDEKAKTAAGKFSFYGYNSVYRASEIPRKDAPWSFKIVHSHEEFKTYYFGASSEQEMKVWMSCIKKEMIDANGGSAIYRLKSQMESSSLSQFQLKLAKEKAAMEARLDDSSFYQDIETNIYDGVHKFEISKDYQAKCSIKKQNEDSDEEEEPESAAPPIQPKSRLDDRPPQPLPEDKKPFSTFTYKDEIAPPTINLNKSEAAPPTPPRPRKDKPPEDAPSKKLDKLKAAIEKKIEPPKSPRARRRGSYEKTDDVGFTPTTDRHVDFRHMRAGSHHSGSGGSTGEEETLPDLEEYWASIHYDGKKERASDIINALAEDGVYLVRPEAAGEGKVLVVYSEEKAKKYRIQTTPEGEYYLAKVGFHDKCLENLLCYYYEEQLPTVSTKLTVPYKLHKKYKNLKL